MYVQSCLFLPARREKGVAFDMNRRDLLRLVGATAAGAGLLALVPSFLRGKRGNGGDSQDKDGDTLQEEPEKVSQPERSSSSTGARIEARYYRKGKNDSVHCDLCFHRCHVSSGSAGFCRNRINVEGTLRNTVYNMPSAVAVEPTEKEPMHHFLPGTNMLCIGTASCNFRCRFCHNWHLSQRSIEQVRRRRTHTPGDLVRIAKSREVPAVSFTYNEPTVFYEYMYDVAVKAKKDGLRTIMHSNGGIESQPLQDLLAHIDAATIDLKAFSQEFYRNICEARLEPVLETLKAIKENGTWLEIVNLVLPGHNDEPAQIREMCEWIRTELGPDVPLHFSRFFPTYRMTSLSPTPVSTLERCRTIALEEGLHFVSIGNVPGHEANSSFCPGCKARIIHRVQYTVSEINLKDGACTSCGRQIPGIWK